jgi:hypothetical protein
MVKTARHGYRLRHQDSLVENWSLPTLTVRYPTSIARSTPSLVNGTCSIAELQRKLKVPRLRVGLNTKSALPRPIYYISPPT